MDGFFFSVSFTCGAFCSSLHYLYNDKDPNLVLEVPHLMRGSGFCLNEAAAVFREQGNYIIIEQHHKCAHHHYVPSLLVTSTVIHRDGGEWRDNQWRPRTKTHRQPLHLKTVCVNEAGCWSLWTVDAARGKQSKKPEQHVLRALALIRRRCLLSSDNVGGFIRSFLSQRKHRMGRMQCPSYPLIAHWQDVISADTEGEGDEGEGWRHSVHSCPSLWELYSRMTLSSKSHAKHTPKHTQHHTHFNTKININTLLIHT